MFVHGFNLADIVNIDVGADAIRIEFANGERKFISEADGGFEVLDAWRLDRRLIEGDGNAE